MCAHRTNRRCCCCAETTRARRRRRGGPGVASAGRDPPRWPPLPRGSFLRGHPAPLFLSLAGRARLPREGARRFGRRRRSRGFFSPRGGFGRSAGARGAAQPAADRSDARRHRLPRSTIARSFFLSTPLLAALSSVGKRGPLPSLPSPAHRVASDSGEARAPPPKAWEVLCDGDGRTRPGRAVGTRGGGENCRPWQYAAPPRLPSRIRGERAIVSRSLRLPSW
jgi:hypothetical protein